MRRKDTNNLHFEQRIPRDVLPRAVGRTLHIPVGPAVMPLHIGDKTRSVRLSLATSDSREAKARAATVSGYLASVWQALRVGQSVPLTYPQAMALARDLYQAWATSQDRVLTADVRLDGSREFDIVPNDLLPDAGALQTVVERLAEHSEDPEAVVGSYVDRFVLAKGHPLLDPASRKMASSVLLTVLADAFRYRTRQAEGDFTPDNRVFPEWQSNPNSVGAAYSLDALLEGWWVDAEAAGRAPNTLRTYTAVINRLALFLGHRDAARITETDIMEFKALLIKEGSKPSSVQSYLAGLKSLFGWAVQNRKLRANPALGAKMMQRKRVAKSNRELSQAEAIAILQMATRAAGVNREEDPFLTLRKRWVPWLCAYTGARVGEIVQLRKQDVYQSGDTWVIRITPEAGTVKDKEEREVVLHEHLIEQGFLAVAKAAKGHIFVRDITKLNNAIRGLAYWASSGLAKDSTAAPNHGWRHLFKTRCRQYGIPDSIADSITGHAPASVGGGYGHVPLETQAEAIAKLPRFVI